MRFLLKVNIPVETGNAAAKAGKLGAIIQSILAELKPEAVYFTDNDGQRRDTFSSTCKTPPRFRRSPNRGSSRSTPALRSTRSWCQTIW